MMMQEQQMHLDPMAPPMSEGPPFTPPPPLAAMAGLHHHAEAHQIHGPLGGFKIEPPHMEPLRLHNGHGGPGSPTPPPPGGPPPPWPGPGQTITENTASFLNSANPPPPPPPSSSGHSPNSILEVTSTMGPGGVPGTGTPSSPGTASSSSNSSSAKKSSSRRNAWGNLSYADLITQAIQSSPEGRLTLSQVYEWMVHNIPYFKDKGDSNSSAGWKNSIRHNLSLHSRFIRVQNEGTGKSSWWMLNPDQKASERGKSSRRRPPSTEGGGGPNGPNGPNSHPGGPGRTANGELKKRGGRKKGGGGGNAMRNRLNAAAAAAAAAAQTTIGIGGPVGEMYPGGPPLPPGDYPPPFGAPPGLLPGDLRSRMLDFGPGVGGPGGRISPVFQGGPLPPRVPNEFGGYQPEWNPEYQHCGGYYQGNMPVRPFCNNEPGSGADDFPEGGPRSISPMGNGGSPRFPPGGSPFIGRPPPCPPPPGFGAAEFHPGFGGEQPEILNGKLPLPTSPLMPPGHSDNGGGANQQQQQQFPSNLQVMSPMSAEMSQSPRSSSTSAANNNATSGNSNGSGGSNGSSGSNSVNGGTNAFNNNHSATSSSSAGSSTAGAVTELPPPPPTTPSHPIPPSTPTFFPPQPGNCQQQQMGQHIPGSPNARTSSTGSTNSSILERALGSKDGGPVSPPPHHSLPNAPPPPHSLPADHFQWPPQHFGPDNGGGGGMEDYIKQEMHNGGEGNGSADYMGHFHGGGPGMMAHPPPPHLHPAHVHPHELHHMQHTQQHHQVIAAGLADPNNPAAAAAVVGQYAPEGNLSHPPWVR